MATLRTEETKRKYDDFIAAGGLEGRCVLCDAPALQTFKFWKIVTNDFPYDRIAKVHDMVVPLRHTDELDCTAEERAEFDEIKGRVLYNEYQFLIESTVRLKTIPSHHHVHAIVLKDW